MQSALQARHNILPLRGPLELDHLVPCLATISSAHCRWAAVQEPLSVQGRVLERRTVPDGLWVGHGYQLVALDMLCMVWAV